MFRVEIDSNCNILGLFHHSLWLVLVLLGNYFSSFETTLFG